MAMGKIIPLIKWSGMEQSNGSRLLPTVTIAIECSEWSAKMRGVQEVNFLLTMIYGFSDAFKTSQNMRCGSLSLHAIPTIKSKR